MAPRKDHEPRYATGVYCISENETPNKDICASIDNRLCGTAHWIRAKGRNVKCPNHRGLCVGNLDRTDAIGNKSRSFERCARKIAQDHTPLDEKFTSDGPYPALFVLVDSGKHLLVKINIFYMFTVQF
jgi:hypothetical protein